LFIIYIILCGGMAFNRGITGLRKYLYLEVPATISGFETVAFTLESVAINCDGILEEVYTGSNRES
jgi:hypothetical protein